MKLKAVALITAATLALSGCVTPPVGPTIPANPGSGKSFEAFQQDEQACETYASQRVAGQAEAANNRAVGSAIIGTALGAGLGAAVGGGRGAGIGAASGAVVGSSIGSDQSEGAQYGIQRRYNIAYGECMTSHGNSVPSFGGYPPRGYPPPPPPGYGPPPPPPPGYYPPPPPPGY
jgi:outer membrane lipoprotein SlyB